MKNGIFCIEGFWDQNNVQDRASVSPLLELLSRFAGIPFIHHRCATLGEIEHMLERWRVKTTRNKYPILYFATHGYAGELDFGKKARLSFEQLGDILAGRCERNIFLFGSCSTMRKKEHHIEAMLEKTGALAAIGFSKKVNWMEATAAELLALHYIQQMQGFDNKGLKELSRYIKEQEVLFNSLGYKMVASPTWYTRSQSGL
jgi:hypothetical protein